MSQGNCLRTLLSFNSCDTNFDATLSPRQVARNFMRKFHESVTQAAWEKKIPGMFQVKIIESAPWTFVCTVVQYVPSPKSKLSQLITSLVRALRKAIISDIFFVCADPATVCLRYTSLLHVPERVLFVILPPLQLSARCPFLCPSSCIPYFPLELTAIKRNSSPPPPLLVLPNFRLLVLYFTIVISLVWNMHLPCIRREWEMRGTNTCIEPGTSEG